MKTTVVLDDNLYEFLREASRHELGSARKVSEYLNKILSDFFARKKGAEFFGSSKRFDLAGYRDENDRFA